MELKYKPDFERAKKYFEAFWQKEVIDRPLVSITAPGKNGSWPDYHEINCVNTFRARGDRDETLRLLEGYERYVAGITWMGEAIPYCLVFRSRDTGFRFRGHNVVGALSY